MADGFSDAKHTGKTDERRGSSPSGLLSSAKVVAGAAKAAARSEMDQVDKAKVAGAAEELLSAASRYGKLEEKSFGKYVKKAENYLHEYQSKSHATGGAVVHNGNSAGGAVPDGTEHRPLASDHQTSSQHERMEGGGGLPYGEYLNLAQKLLKKL